MFYYLFEVRTNKPDIVPNYYILNNQYIGYIGHDSCDMRSILENHAGVSEKLQYQLFATGHSPDFDEIHDLNCGSHRFTEEEAKALVEKHKWKLKNDDTWYVEYQPSQNSSKTILRSLDKTKKIKGY